MSKYSLKYIWVNEMNKKKCPLFGKRRVSSDERFQMIVKAASPLFARKGFDGTTTKEIAKASGISEALLYRHFASKEVLYREIQNAMCCQKQDATERLIELPNSTDTLVVITYFFVEHVFLEGKESDEHHRTIKHLMAHSFLEDGVFAKSFLENSFYPILEKLIACADVSQKEGHIVEGAIPSNLGIWFGHHLIVMMGLMALPPNRLVDYQHPKKEVMMYALRFILRGMGMKDDVLEAKLQPETLEKLLAPFCPSASE